MQAFLRVLLYVLSLVTGMMLIVLGASAELRDEFFAIYQQQLLTPPGQIISVALGVVLTLVPPAIAFRGWASRRYAREISYPTETGRVSVSLVAIEEALTRAVEQEDVVRKVHVRVTEDRVRRLVLIEAALTLWDDENITVANRRCQEILGRRFRELMPERTVQVHLNVHRLNQRRHGDEAPPQPRPPAAPGQAETRETEAAGLLPGLAATHGEVDNAAGAALLANRKETRHRDESGRLAPVDDDDDDDADDEAVPAGEAGSDDVDYNDLYVGPTYPVDNDDDDYSGRPLPAG